MSKKIKIILLEDITGLGQVGDIVSATEGYARNFLFPQGKAALADESALNQSEQKKQKAKQQAATDLASLQKQAETIDGTELTLTARVKEGEGEELYAKITAKQIADQLNKDQASLDISTKSVVLAEPINQLGTYDVIIQLSPEVEASLKVTIVSTESDEQ